MTMVMYTTGIELAIDAVCPIANSQANVHTLGDISSGSHFQYPPNHELCLTVLLCPFLQILVEETLRNISSPQSKCKTKDIKKKNQIHHLEIVMVSC
jgi:hypothetical protein